MYAITFHLYHNVDAPWLSTAIYEQLAATYKLPTVNTLLTSLEQDVSWRDCDPDLQVYFLDNLKEQNRRNLFQVRFKTSPKAAEHTALFASVEPDTKFVHDLTCQFPARGDRGCSANLIAWLKEIHKVQGITPEFECAGFGERNDLLFIREHSLSAYRWEDAVGRYLHVRDYFDEVKEVKKFLPYRDRRP